MGGAAESLDATLAYHQRTKHHPGRYARSLGHMDWATQPDPFRRFVGAPLLSLDLVPAGDQPRFDDLGHRTFALAGDAFQIVYHFTRGAAVDDARLQTVPAYQHLKSSGAPS